MKATRALIIGTVVVAAFGGALIDRAVVATPAWEQLGPAAWAAYSCHADLGNGLIAYPIYGIGLAVLAIAAAISYRLDVARPDRPASASIWRPYASLPRCGPASQPSRGHRAPLTVEVEFSQRREVGSARAGRLVLPDQGFGEDVDAELSASDVGIDGGAAPPKRPPCTSSTASASWPGPRIQLQGTHFRDMEL